MITLEKLHELAVKYEAEVGQAVHHFIDFLKAEVAHLFHHDAAPAVDPVVDPAPAPAVDPAQVVDNGETPVEQPVDPLANGGNAETPNEDPAPAVDPAPVSPVDPIA